MITHDRLVEVLAYDADTGVFTWRKATNLHIVVGSAAGSIVGRGYLQVRIDKRNYQAHRLAWLYVYGCWPAGSIDHINGVKLDNRVCNLRDVTHAHNMQNQHRAHKNSKTGVLGVSMNGAGFTAAIKVGGKRYGLGTYKTVAEAGEAYQVAKRKLHIRR
jgi:hypothetical protein